MALEYEGQGYWFSGLLEYWGTGVLNSFYHPKLFPKLFPKESNLYLQFNEIMAIKCPVPGAVRIK